MRRYASRSTILTQPGADRSIYLPLSTVGVKAAAAAAAAAAAGEPEVPAEPPPPTGWYALGTDETLWHSTDGTNFADRTTEASFPVGFTVSSTGPFIAYWPKTGLLYVLDQATKKVHKATDGYAFDDGVDTGLGGTPRGIVVSPDEMLVYSTGITDHVRRTTNGTSWASASYPASPSSGVVNRPTHVAATGNWLHSTSGNRIFYSTNGGVSWLLSADLGSSGTNEADGMWDCSYISGEYIVAAGWTGLSSLFDGTVFSTDNLATGTWTARIPKGTSDTGTYHARMFGLRSDGTRAIGVGNNNTFWYVADNRPDAAQIAISTDGTTWSQSECEDASWQAVGGSQARVLSYAGGYFWAAKSDSVLRAQTGADDWLEITDITGTDLTWHVDYVPA